MLLGLSIVPLITFMGCAVDYSRVTSIKASLNSAADAAALNAVTRAINGAAAVPVVAPPSTTQIRAYFNGASNDSQYVGPEDYDSTSTSIPADASFTYNIFYTGPTGTCPTQLAETSPAPAAFGATGATQYASLPDNLKVQSFARGTQSGPNFAAAKIDYNTPTGSVATPCTPNSYIATVSYSAPIPTSILQVVGIKQVMIHGTATAQSKLPSYLNFYMLMDNSPSMGIGGSATDIANLEALTSKWDSNGGCAFACHERNPDGTDDPNDYYHVALNNGVKTRIDYLRDAVASLLGVAQTTQQVPNQFQFGLYTFSNTTTQTVVSPLSSNYTTLLSDTQNIKLGYNSVNNPKMNMYGDVNAGPDEETDIDAAMKFAGAQVATAYTTPRPPVNFVVLVSDGVQDKVDCNTTGTTSG
ncbi:MAG: hypothetical protein KGQ37_12385, partial [Hyphomicrobiales bacterium]|nr:hypothetical protein [Hyphomicrobiales bacterium]